MATIVGRVVQVQPGLQIVGEDGQPRALSVGDPIYSGDQIGQLGPESLSVEWLDSTEANEFRRQVAGSGVDQGNTGQDFSGQRPSNQADDQGARGNSVESNSANTRSNRSGQSGNTNADGAGDENTGNRQQGNDFQRNANEGKVDTRATTQFDHAPGTTNVATQNSGFELDPSETANEGGEPPIAQARFSVSGGQIAEGGELVFVITRSSDFLGEQNIDYRTAILTGDSAGTGDFTGVAGTASFAAGQTRVEVRVATLADALVESNESLSLVIENATGPAVISQSSAQGWILDATVPPSNQPPEAADDSYSVDEDGTLNGRTVLGNDSDLDGDILTVNTTPVTDVSHGTLTLNADGTFTYTPDANYHGTDTFTYEVSDGNGGNGGTAQATVTITVNPVNDDPVAVDDTYNTDEDTPLTTTLLNDILENDSDLDGDTLTVNTTPVTDVSHGTLTLNADGTFTYTPDANYHGSDSFTYEVSDGNGGTAQATVTITVNPVNDDPVAVDDSNSVTEGASVDVTGTVGLLSNDSDPDSDPLVVTGVRTGSESGTGSNTGTTGTLGSTLTGDWGTLTLNADGSYHYVADSAAALALNTGDVRQDVFTYSISDGQGGSDTAELVITVNGLDGANQNPTAVDDSYSTDEDTPLTTTLLNDILGNDSDLDLDTLVVNTTPVTDVSHGSLTLNADGTFTYTPDANYHGTDSFTYEVSDGNGGTDQATVTITVNPVNDDPVAVDDTYITDEDTPLTTTLLNDVLENDSDLDLDTLTVNTTPVTDVSHGSLTLNADGTFTYTPDANYHGTDSFTYEVSDGNGGTDQATVTITVNPVNDDPVAVDDSYSTNEDTPLTTTLLNDILENDSDLDGDTLTVNTTPVTDVSHGTLTLNADGTFTYTPDANYHGTDSFTYEVSDGNGGTAQATVTITVNPVNDLPTAVDKTIGVEQDGSYTLTQNDFGFADIDGDSMASITVTDMSGVDDGSLLFFDGSSWSAVTSGQVITTADIDAGNLAFRPADGETGVPYDSFDFTVNDGTGSSITDNSITFNVANTLSVSSPTPIDEGKSAVFVVELSGTRGVNTVLDLTVGGDVDASDISSTLYYKEWAPDGQSWSWQAVTGGQVTLAAGDTSVEIKITSLQDGLADNGETLSLEASINGYAESDMANTSDTGSTLIYDYPSIRVSAPDYVNEGDDAIFEVSLSSPKATDTLMDLSLGGVANASDYEADLYYSTDGGNSWQLVTGAQITIPGNVNLADSVLVRVSTLQDGSTEGNESLVLNAVTSDAGIANQSETVADSTVIVDGISLTVSESKDGAVVEGVNTANTASDSSYSYSVLTQGAHGTVTDNGDGTLKYTPDTDYSGTDSFTYIRTDSAGNETYAEAQVTVVAVADTPDVTITASSGTVTGLPDVVSDGTFSTSTSWKTVSYPGNSGNYNSDYDTASYLVPVSGQASLPKSTSMLQQFGTALQSGDSYTISLDFVSGSEVSLKWAYIDATGAIDASFTGAPIASAITTTGALSYTSSVPVDGSGNVANAILIESSAGGNPPNLVIDNLVVQGDTRVEFDVQISHSITDALNDTAGTEYEFIQDTVTLSGVPVGATFSNDGGSVGTNTTNNGSGTDSWTFTQAELDGLTISVPQASATTGFSLTATVTAEENSSGSTASNSDTVSLISTDDVPVIGDQQFTFANEFGTNTTISNTIATDYSADGGNVFSWNSAASNLPELYADGQKLAFSYDDGAGTLTGTIDGGATTVFRVTVNMEDADSTDVTWEQPVELFGVSLTFDGGIVLPGGGNNDTVVLQFNDSNGDASGVDAIIAAHNLIEDSDAELASAAAEHTVNTNNYYIGVDSNNMNAGDQLIIDFATIATDSSGNTSHNNQVSVMGISLFNFGSAKSGDELFITVITDSGRENYILTSDADLVDGKYTVTSANGEAILGVEFLAGNNSSFKLGVESISAIDYSQDIDLSLAYDITDVDGSSDGGTLSIHLDANDEITWTSSMTRVDAGNAQDGSGVMGYDTLVFNSGDSIDFSALDNPELLNFEIIDLTKDADTGTAGAHSLTNLALQDVIDMTDVNNDLIVFGDGSDAVQLVDNGGWSLSGTTSQDGHDLNIYVNSADVSVQLKIEDTVNVSFI